MKDIYGREINYMRISITDLCNLRCKYCMPGDVEKISMKDILTFEEIELSVRAAANLGISHIRLTGGEPLVRRGCVELVNIIKNIPRVEDIGMTTNGVLLKKQLPFLVAAGLSSVNISLDTLDRETFKDITGFDELDTVLEGIYAASDAGLRVKINAVLQTGINNTHWRDLIDIARDNNIHVRFIEMMPIGFGNSFTPIKNDTIIEKIKEEFGEVAQTNVDGNGPAKYISIPGFKGSIGFISAMHGKFCNECNRIRLTSTGTIKPCLCFSDGVDIKSVLRLEENRDKKLLLLEESFKEALRIKPKEHVFETKSEITEKHSMIDIGG